MPSVNATALDGDIAGLTGTAGLEVDITRGTECAAASIVGVTLLQVFAAGAAQTQADTDAAGLISQVTIGIAIDCVLAGLHGVNRLVGVHSDIGGGQGLHTTGVSVACRLGLGLDRLYRLDHWAGNSECEARLLELVFTALLAGFTGFLKGEGLCTDVDIPGRGQHIRPCLSVGVTGCKADVTGYAAHRTGRRGGDRLLGIMALLLTAQGDTDPAAAEQAGFFGLGELAVAVTVVRGFDGQIVVGVQTQVGIAEYIRTANA